MTRFNRPEQYVMAWAFIIAFAIFFVAFVLGGLDGIAASIAWWR